MKHLCGRSSKSWVETRFRRETEGQRIDTSARKMARGSLHLSHNRDTLRPSTSTSSVAQSINRHQDSSARFDSEQIVTPSVCHGKSGSWMTVSSFSVGSSFRSLPGLPPSTALDLSHIQASCNRNPSILMTDLLSAPYQSGQLLVNRVGITGIAAGMPCHEDEDGCLPSIQLAASLLAG
jgi:hypothetical protein